MKLNVPKCFDVLREALSAAVDVMVEKAQGIVRSTRNAIGKLGFTATLAANLAACSEAGLSRLPESDDDDDTVEIPGDDDDTVQQSSDDNGIWFWDPTPVLTNKETWGDAVDVLTLGGFNAVYQAFDNAQLVERADEIAIWNGTLALLGISSDLLVSESGLLCYPDEIDARVQAFADYQSSRSGGEEFDGLHLDLEPHALNGTVCPGYDTWDETSRGDRLYQLSNNFVYALSRIRGKLNDAGMSNTRIVADLPVWFDQIYDPENDTGLWDTVAERDEFFQNIAEQVDGITFLAYCRDNVASIESSIDTEVDVLPSNFHVRIGVNARETVGNEEDECETWQSPLNRVQVEEGLFAKGWPVDVHDMDQLIREREE